MDKHTQCFGWRRGKRSCVSLLDNTSTSSTGLFRGAARGYSGRRRSANADVLSAFCGCCCYFFGLHRYIDRRGVSFEYRHLTILQRPCIWHEHSFAHANQSQLVATTAIREIYEIEIGEQKQSVFHPIFRIPPLTAFTHLLATRIIVGP